MLQPNQCGDRRSACWEAPACTQFATCPRPPSGFYGNIISGGATASTPVSCALSPLHALIVPCCKFDPSRCIKWMLTPVSVRRTPCPPRAGRSQTLSLQHRCSSPSTPRRPVLPQPRPPPPQHRCLSHWQGQVAVQALLACRQQRCGCMSPRAEAARRPACNASGLHMAHAKGFYSLQCS